MAAMISRRCFTGEAPFRSSEPRLSHPVATLATLSAVTLRITGTIDEKGLVTLPNGRFLPREWLDCLLDEYRQNRYQRITRVWSTTVLVSQRASAPEAETKR